MASFINSVNKGITAFSMKTSNFAEITKCRTYISTMENEIEKLKSDLGNAMYEMHKSGEKDMSVVEGIYVEIDAKYQNIEAQKEKIRQMEEEEKQVLGNVQKAEAPKEMIFCGQCGTQNASNYKFCVKCGSSLD